MLLLFLNNEIRSLYVYKSIVCSKFAAEMRSAAPCDLMFCKLTINAWFIYGLYICIQNSAVSKSTESFFFRFFYTDKNNYIKLSR